jgi:hypothetical protein
MAAQRPVFGEIVDKLLRAAQNGERLHLDVRHVRALISSPVYPILTELQVEELQREWLAENGTAPDPDQT